MWDLDRDILVDPGVFGEVNGPEATAAERGEDLIFSEHLPSK